MSRPEVVIDGVRYVPAQDAPVGVREAIARELASFYWGGLPAGPAWETAFNEHMSGVFFNVSEENTCLGAPTGPELLQRIMDRIEGGGAP